VDTLIDIGVGRGTPPLYDPRIASRFVLVDPNPIPDDTVMSLRQLGVDVEVHRTALGDAPGEATFRINTNSHHSGFRPATDGFVHLESPASHETVVPVQRLDDLLAGRRGDLGRYALKIDTEGFEDSVIAGAPEILNHARFVIMEVSLKRRFSPAYKPSDIVQCLAGHGLEVADILNASLRTPWYLDILFARWSSDVFDAPA
jgi:FkbM family methyltransferase